jgi:probable phosphoglycerate mutase
MTRFMLIRHGHVDWIAPERFRGRAELALSDLGRRQIAATAGRIRASARPVAIYTSPMGRCVETAQAIAAPFGLEPWPVGALTDIDYGRWQGLTREEVRARWPAELELWLRQPHLAVIPGGETLAAVHARLAAALALLVREHREDTVVLVGHDSVNRVLLLGALDLPLSHYWRIKQDPAAVSEFRYEDGGFRVESLNGTWHLAGC